ncbi:hypothetical protein Xedl_01657 [Xenorhabdus eapokensis]|uniref:Uncharacterized protein n=1 Tax=Xenorhabdus eapokensis TaxID=1873482 RepID=A0A1Q5TTY7_9GAMM|nr:hypothetical protein Xedl_01657 [Xenorhabdus eapokensis]
MKDKKALLGNWQGFLLFFDTVLANCLLSFTEIDYLKK